jgi:hypothetical protein
MLPSFINPSHVTEEYEQRLQDSARNARFRSAPGDSVLRQRLGRWIIGLGELVHGHHPSTIDEPANVQWVTD